MTRRRFLRDVSLWVAGGALAACGVRPREQARHTDTGENGREHAPSESDSDASPVASPSDAPRGETRAADHLIPRRPFGRTGLSVGIFGLGGAIAVAEGRERAEEIVERAIDLGVNYIDTAHQYGPSESNIGGVMARRRAEVILASKTDDRTYDGTMRQFEESLTRLRTDYLDVYQLHAIHTEADLRTALSDHGALKAIEKLKTEGAVRHVGITGHKNTVFFARAIAEYPFECVLMSLNAGDVHFDSMVENVLPVALERRMGIVAMKIAAYDGRIFRAGGIETMDEALGYTLTHPVSTAIVGIGSIAELEEDIRIAREFTPFSRGEMNRIEDLTKPYADAVNFFKYRW